MKKMLKTFIISLVFTLVILFGVTFMVRTQTSEEKKNFRGIADNIALNLSGQGLSNQFIPKSEKDEGQFKFLTCCRINKDNKSGILYVTVIKGSKIHTVKYPCQVQDKILYSIGIEYANEMTFSVIEYLICGLLIFLITYAVIITAKVLKS